MTANEDTDGRCGPRSCWRGARGPNQYVGPPGSVPVALTVAILTKSGKKLKECKGPQFRIKGIVSQDPFKIEESCHNYDDGYGSRQIYGSIHLQR